MRDFNQCKCSFSKKYIMPIFILFLLYPGINSLTNKEINFNYNNKLLDTISFDSYPDHKTPYNRTTEQDSEDSTDISIIINFSYPVFIILTFLLLCALCIYEEEKELVNGILFFIYLTNNGYILVSLSIKYYSHQDEIAFYFLLVELVILGIGTIACLIKFCKIFCKNPLLIFSCNAIWFLLSLPCKYIWSVLGITDPCFEQDSYTVYTYSDGYMESDYCCVCVWK